MGISIEILACEYNMTLCTDLAHRCINFRIFHGPVKFIHKNEEMYIVRCNSHLYFSKSTKIYPLENLYPYGMLV